MATTPDLDIVNHLNTNVAALTKGTNLFYGPVRGQDTPDASYIPDEAVFVLSSGGPEPNAFLGSINTCEEIFSSLTIRVRSAPDDFDGGQTLARSVRDALHHQTITGYVNVTVREADPAYLGVIDKKLHEWSIGVTCHHYE